MLPKYPIIPQTIRMGQHSKLWNGKLDRDVGQEPSGSSWLDIDENGFNFCFTIIVAKH